MTLQSLNARGAKGVSTFIFTFLIGLVACCGWLSAAEKQPTDPPDVPAPRYRVLSLKHISAERAIKFLDGVGTVSPLPKGNALLVTGLRNELVKASAIVRVVDAPEEFVIKPILPVSEKTAFPALERIQALLPEIAIGTFLQPPDNLAVDRAVIDIHKDAVVVVASAGRVDEIISAVALLRNGKVPAAAKAGGPEPDTVSESAAPTAPAFEQPADTGKNNGTDELFDKLVNSLQKAEQTQKAAQVPEKLVPEFQPPAREPNEPAAAQARKIIAVPQMPEEPPAEISVKILQPEIQAPAEPVKQTPADAGEQEPAYHYQPQPLIDGNEMLDLDLPQELQIADLLRLVGEYCRLDYMYDAKKITGPVTLKLRGPIKVRDLYPLLESVLKFKGFVMTRKGSLVTIVPQDEVLNIDPVLLDGRPGRIEVGDIMVTRVFQLEHADTESAGNLLTGMKLGIDVTPIPAAGTLIVTGYAYRMPRIEKLLEMIDVPGQPKKFRFRQLKYTMAKTLAPKIEALAEQLGTVSITVAKPQATQAAPAPRRGARRPTPTKKPSSAEQAPKPEEVYLDADERTNRILMIGLEEQLAVVEQLIDSLDVEKQDLRALRLYDIQYVDAEEVVEKLGELEIISGTGTRADRSRITSRTQKPTRAAATAAAETEEPLEEEPQVVIIESTNSLLVNATDRQHIQIATIISYIDSETLEETIPYKIYSLENQSPEDLAEVLNKLVQEVAKEKKDDKIQKTASSEKREQIVIVPDENTFSIIVYASQKNQKWIETLIEKLDKRRPQVLIDVSLVEITEDDEFEYDLNILANTKEAIISNILTGGLPLDTSAIPLNKTLGGGWNLKDKEGKNTRQVQGFYGEDRIQAMFTMMASKGYGRVLARPKILVNDNEEGTIKTTQKTHVRETTLTYAGRDSSGEAIPMTGEKWTPYEAKIELGITPHISQGNLLRLEVVMVREDFVETTAGPPDYRTSDIDTVVTVPDGSTIILGGLTKLNQTKGTSKVPLLGDIPIAGALFRSVDNADTGSKLYIFVKANILRPDETAEGLAQLRDISIANRLRFEADERKFQSLETWPGVKPEPFDPLRVLDDE